MIFDTHLLVALCVEWCASFLGYDTMRGATHRCLMFGPAPPFRPAPRFRLVPLSRALSTRPAYPAATVSFVWTHSINAPGPWSQRASATFSRRFTRLLLLSLLPFIRSPLPWPPCQRRAVTKYVRIGEPVVQHKCSALAFGDEPIDAGL